MDVRISLMERIVFIGGNANLPNFEKRIIEEFDNYWRNNLNTLGDNSSSYSKEKGAKNFLQPVKTNFPKELLSLKGLYLLSHIIQQSDYISRSEYNEEGAVQSLKRKNLNKLNIF
jgi:actin-related protein